MGPTTKTADTESPRGYGGGVRPIIGLTSRTMMLPAARQTRPAETTARAYVDAIEASGGLCVVLPNTAPAAAGALLDRIDGLVLTGGDDPHPRAFGEQPHPRIDVVDERRDLFEYALVTEALERDLAVFGICRGVQMMNIALGGDIFQDLVTQAEHPICHSQRTVEDAPWHDLVVAPGTVLHEAVGAKSIAVNSFHHQSCRGLGQGLVASAWTSDGLVEALEHPSRSWFLGVQWHPELLPGRAGRELFGGFVAAAASKSRDYKR